MNNSNMPPETAFGSTVPTFQGNDARLPIFFNLNNNTIITEEEGAEPWLRQFEVTAIDRNEGGRQVGICQAKLIMRERLPDPQCFKYSMEQTAELEEFAKDSGIFEEGTGPSMKPMVMSWFFDAHGFFESRHCNWVTGSRPGPPPSTTIAPFDDSSPGNRAWILYFENICVEEGYRRFGIGTIFVDLMLGHASEAATNMERPLLAVTRPGYLHIDYSTPTVDSVSVDSGETLAQVEDPVSVQFWTSLNFTRYTLDATGKETENSQLFFWGVPKGIPNKSGFIITPAAVALPADS